VGVVLTCLRRSNALTLTSALFTARSPFFSLVVVVLSATTSVLDSFDCEFSLIAELNLCSRRRLHKPRMLRQFAQSIVKPRPNARVPVALYASRLPTVKDLNNKVTELHNDTKYDPALQPEGYSLAPTNKGEAVVASVDKLMNWARAGADVATWCEITKRFFDQARYGR
jgi:hypothetical protein